MACWLLWMSADLFLKCTSWHHRFQERHTPDGHCAHQFLKSGDVLFLKDMVGMMSVVDGAVRTDHSEPRKPIWGQNIWHPDPVVLLVFLERRRMEFCNGCFIILHQMSDLLVTLVGANEYMEA